MWMPDGWEENRAEDSTSTREEKGTGEQGNGGTGEPEQSELMIRFQNNVFESLLTTDC